MKWSFCTYIVSVIIFIHLIFPLLFLIRHWQIDFQPNNKKCNGVLFITAHPDDETAFFVPIIRFLKKKGHEIYLLCLSVGERCDGEVNIFTSITRLKELKKACESLGISPNHVYVGKIPLNYTYPDGQTFFWNSFEVSDTIDNLYNILFPQSRQILICNSSYNPTVFNDVDMIISFDRGGISGHINHRAAGAGMRHFCKTNQLTICYELVTKPMIFRIFGIFYAFTITLMDIIEDFFKNMFWVNPRLPNIISVTSPSSFDTVEAITHHTSQLHFHRLWLSLTSSYSYTNTIQKI